MLDQEEYVEQSYFFRVLSEQLPKNLPLQELLEQTQEELLASTKLPLAIDYLLDELRHTGRMSSAMRQLSHYFSPFQTYVISEAEEDAGRFDMRTAVELLRTEADYRAKGPSVVGLFLFQFESLCRNRLEYDRGLWAVAQDPMFDEPWSTWILTVRRQIGLVDFADLLFVRSEHYQVARAQRLGRALNPKLDEAAEAASPTLFGEKEGKIALANRRKEMLFLFAALQRHLGYPEVPRPRPRDDTQTQVPLMLRRMERMEARIKLLEEEQRQSGIDLSKFYNPDSAEGE